MAEADSFVYAIVGIIVSIFTAYLIGRYFYKKAGKKGKEDLKDHRREMGNLMEDFEHAKKVAGSDGKVRFRKDKKIVASPPDHVERKDTFAAEKSVEHSTDTFVAEKKKTFTVDAVLVNEQDKENPSQKSKEEKKDTEKDDEDKNS